MNCEQGVVFVVRESTFGEVSFALRHANVTELIIEDKNTRSSVQVALILLYIVAKLEPLSSPYLN